jgi:hypothetical protein
LFKAFILYDEKIRIIFVIAKEKVKARKGNDLSILN